MDEIEEFQWVMIRVLNWGRKRKKVLLLLLLLLVIVNLDQCR